MIIGPPSLDALFYGFNTDYSRGYMRVETFFQKLCQEVASAGSEVRYGWLDLFPRMREWLGERQMKNLSLREFTVVNKDYEDSVRVPVNKIKDDQYGIFSPAMEMLGRAAKILPDQLTTSLLVGGDSAICFDGQYFFDIDHPLDIDNGASVLQSNLLATTPLSPASYAAGRAQMRGFKGRDGSPLGVSPNVLMVGTDNEQMGRQILNAELIGNPGGTAAVSNVYKSSAELVVNPYLPAGDWYLFDTSMPVKPLVHQTREAAQMVPLVSPTDPNVFFHKEFIYSVQSREAVGYGLWFLALKGRAAS